MIQKKSLKTIGKKLLNRLKIFSGLILLSGIISCRHSVGIACTEMQPTTSSPVVSRTVYVDDRFTSTEMKWIRESADQWKTATGNRVEYRIQVVNKDLMIPLDKSSEYSCPDTSVTGQVTYLWKAFATDPIVVKLEAERNKNDGSRVAGFANGACDSDITWIYMVINFAKGEEEFKNTLVHEIGHTLGLGHVDIEYGSVMYPTIDRSSKCITEIDIDNFCNEWDC